VPTVIVRFFNTVGPRQIGRYGMVLPRFVAAALAGEPLHVYGDGRQTRSFCDVRDVVEVLPEMMAIRACQGGIFNLGRDEPISILDLAELVTTTLASESPIELVPYEQAFGPDFDDLQDRVPDLTRLRSVVPFEPRFSLERTILDMAEHVRLHRSGPSLETSI
jgi:UDP-glucose 4-epimerase